MLYLCLVALLAGCVLADDNMADPNLDNMAEPVLYSPAQLSDMGIILPLGAEGVSESCVQSSAAYYDNEVLAQIPVGSEDEAYYCAFASFQANKDKSTNLYADQDEAAERFDIFKGNVDMVNEHNADETQTWKMGINFFADMTDEEKSPYHNGLRRPGSVGFGA